MLRGIICLPFPSLTKLHRSYELQGGREPIYVVPCIGQHLGQRPAYSQIAVLPGTSYLTSLVLGFFSYYLLIVVLTSQVCRDNVMRQPMEKHMGLGT